MKKVSLVGVAILSLVAFSSLSMAESSFWDKAKEGASSAVDWTKDKTEKGLDAAKEGSETAVDWTKKTAKKAKKGVKESLED